MIPFCINIVVVPGIVKLLQALFDSRHVYKMETEEISYVVCINIPLSSKLLKRLRNLKVTPLYASLQSLSMRVLCTLASAIYEAQSLPRVASIQRHISTFSPPLSVQTLDGMPYISQAPLKRGKTVDARLLLLHFQKVINLE